MYKRPNKVTGRNKWSLAELSTLNDEEIDELMNADPEEINSGEEENDKGEFEDSDVSMDDPDYRPAVEKLGSLDNTAALEEISAEDEDEIEKCVAQLEKCSSPEYITETINISFNMDNLGEQLQSSTSVKQISPFETQLMRSAAGVERQRITDTVVRLSQKPKKRPRSPLPLFDVDGPQFHSNSGGFIGIAMEINPKSTEFKNIVWRKKNLQKHTNEIAFKGNFSLPDEIMRLETPYQCFEFFFTEEFIDSVVQFSNLNAKRQNIGSSFCVNHAEIRKFIGILIFMSLIRMPSADRYWGKHAFTPIKQTMSSKRFFEIRKYLCFNDFSEMKKVGESGYDSQFKIRKIIDHLNQRFDMVPKKPRLCVDEQMCATKLQSRFRQYLPNKPHKWGMKLFVLCDSDGYSYRFELYSGAGDNITAAGFPDLGATSNVVIRLAATVPTMVNHIIYFDNFYTSLPLLVLLRSMGIYSLGTIKRDRIPNCKLPSDKDSKMKRGETLEYVGQAHGIDISTVQWKDTKNVRLASTYVGTLPFSKSNDEEVQPGKAIRYDRKDKNYLEVNCPQIISEYNSHMGGVDAMDGLLGRYKIRLKTSSYSHRLFYHFIDMTVVNSYLLHRRIQENNPDYQHVELPDFRFHIADILTKYQSPEEKNAVGRPPKATVSRAGGTKTYLPPPETRFDQYGHWPKILDVKGKKKCKLPGCKYETQVICTKCNLNLCLTKDRNCFVQFHLK